MPHNPDFDSLVRSRRSIFPASFTGEMGFFYLGVPVAELPPLWDRGSVEPLVNWVRG